MYLEQNRTFLPPFYHKSDAVASLSRCLRFNDSRQDLFEHVRKTCPRFDLLNDENKLFYLLNLLYVFDMFHENVCECLICNEMKQYRKKNNKKIKKKNKRWRDVVTSSIPGNVKMRRI